MGTINLLHARVRSLGGIGGLLVTAPFRTNFLHGTVVPKHVSVQNKTMTKTIFSAIMNTKSSLWPLGISPTTGRERCKHKSQGCELAMQRKDWPPSACTKCKHVLPTVPNM